MFAIFLRNPILAIMLNLALIAAGLFAATRLNVDPLPALNIAVITVETRLEGATPEQIESQLTIPVENVLAVVGGLDELSSTSSTGLSSVQAQFVLGVDPNVAMAECRDKVEAILDTFPQGTLRPTFLKFSLSEMPILKLALTSDQPVRELTELATWTIIPKLQTVQGVGQVTLFGGRKRVIQMELDAERLNEHDLTVTQVADALRAHATQVPGGRLTSAADDYLLQLETGLTGLRDFEQIAVTTPVDAPEGDPSVYYSQPVQLGQLGRVVDGEEEATTLSRLNGKPALTLSIAKTSDANVLKVTDGVKDRLESMKAELPPGVELRVVSDESDTIRKSVADLKEDLVLGAVLASLTVFVFLLDLKLTLIAALAIPVSLIGTLSFMLAMGFTLNFVTLLALSLATGIVIDDAIVVLENIASTLNAKGLSAFDAALEGSQEIAFAVLATTLSLIVLFLPLGFMPGTVGLYFKSWAITMAIAIALSLWVSFSLTPVLCAMFLRGRPGGPEGPGRVTRLMQWAYALCLGWALRLRYLVLLSIIPLLLWGSHLLGEVGKEFIAKEDQSNYVIQLSMPPGWPMERTARELAYVEADLRRLPHVRDFLLTCKNAGEAEIQVLLTDYDKRKPYTQFDSMQDARALLSRYALLQPAVLASGQPKDLDFTILGPRLDLLGELSQRLRAELVKVPGVVDVGTTSRPGAPEVNVTLKPEQLGDLQVNPSDAYQTVSTLIGGNKVASWQSGARNYPVRLRLMASQRDQPEDLDRLYVPSRKQGLKVPLSSVAQIERGSGPTSILRFQRQRKVSVQANLTAGVTLDQAYTKTQELFESLHPPAGYGPVRTADSKQMDSTATAALQSFLLSVLFMYMVMASQFRNLVDPVIILLTLPLAIPFAIWSLVAAGMTLNLFSVLGMFLLFGVVKKNAILQIDETNRLLGLGMEVRPAILQANRDRLRPILMTTLTLVLAMVPVAMAPPTGAQRAPMAMVVVGGQSLCLFLTLLVVPCATAVLEDIKRWRR